jgi:AraC-like DNA-binding protein
MRSRSTAPMVNKEYFSSYRGLLWHPAQPLVVIHQRYDAGLNTGSFQHEDFHALYMVQSGRGIHVINGHPYAIAPGDVYMTPPGAIHEYREYQRLRAEAFCFQASLFSDDELSALRLLEGFWNLFIPSEPAQTGVVKLHLSPERRRSTARMIEEILAEMESCSVAAPILVRGLLFRLLVYLARIKAEPGDARSSNPHGHRVPARGPSLADVVRVCEDRFAEPLLVPQLAALMFLSPGHFSELFAREVGMPPASYVRRLRLERAQTLLRTTALSATEIARQSGFNDPAQLSRAFRTAFRMTPSAYRARSMQGNWMDDTGDSLARESSASMVAEGDTLGHEGTS